ncbi:MAG TPA: MetQ/NlpA family ABC transporter substrate-binding protein, partial [Polyangiaceae bacterium]|nr:MetQ/NlpA family ABC transporter substrate-binding protein [Polyangiaceae bacterium]
LPQIIGILKTEVARQGYVLDWVVVNDIIQPNKLVDEGSADSNSFQHEPYLDQFVRDHGLKNVTRAFYTYFTPSGLYSRRYRSLSQLPDGATIGIPVDPANNGRALFMLRDHGLLSLREGVPVTHASVRDITANPRGLRFVEVDQLMLLRTLDSVDVGFLFSGNAVLGGLDPRRDALALEDVAVSPYKGVVAVHRSVLGSPKVEALRHAYESDAIRAYFRKRYGDTIIFLGYLNAPLASGTAPAPTSPAALAPPSAAPPAPASFRLQTAFAHVAAAGPEWRKAALETLFMLGVTIPLAVLLGGPLGTVLFLTRPGSLIESPRLYVALNGVVNFVRSFPFLILLIALIPLTKLLVGSALGTRGAIVPMVINSIPYFARFAEQNLLEVNRGAIEAAESMGASRWRIIWSVLYGEARSGIAGSITILTVSFLSYSTVAGLVGGGGIGDFAIRYGYYRYQTDVMIFTIVVIIALVQLIQFTGNRLVRQLDKRV